MPEWSQEERRMTESVANFATKAATDAPAIVQDASLVTSDVAAVVRDPSTIAAHLTSIVGVVIAAIVLIHPGFHPPAGVAAAIGSVSILVAGISQIAHLVTLRQAKTTLAVHKA